MGPPADVCPIQGRKFVDDVIINWPPMSRPAHMSVVGEAEGGGSSTFLPSTRSCKCGSHDPGLSIPFALLLGVPCVPSRLRGGFLLAKFPITTVRSYFFVTGGAVDAGGPAAISENTHLFPGQSATDGPVVYRMGSGDSISGQAGHGAIGIDWFGAIWEHRGRGCPSLWAGTDEKVEESALAAWTVHSI